MSTEQSKYQFTELQEKWLQALESGEYKQAKGELHCCGGWCCLGVACHATGTEFVYGDVFLPASLVIALRLNNNRGSSRHDFQIGGEWYGSLANANDYGCTFAEIAAALRANPENFFLPPKVQP